MLSLIGISFYGGPISYGFFALVTATPIISLVYLLYVYIFFRIYQEIGTRRLVAGVTTPFFFMLVNEYWFVFTGVRVKFFSSFSSISGLSDKIEYELLPGTEIRKETLLLCKYRGEYEVGIKTVEITDYFRLFKFSYHNKETLRTIVRPQIIHLESLKNSEINHAIKEASDQQMYPDVLARAYVQGDDIRQIHWSLSAKSGELMTRLKTGENRQGVGIVFDTMRYSLDEAVYLPAENKVLETVLALALVFAEKNILTSVYHLEQELYVNTIENISAYDAFYEKIAEVRFDDNRTDEKLVGQLLSNNRTLFSHKTVFMILQGWTPLFLDIIGRLSESSVNVVVCLISAEEVELDLSGLTGTSLINISPDDDLREVL